MFVTSAMPYVAIIAPPNKNILNQIQQWEVLSLQLLGSIPHVSAKKEKQYFTYYHTTMKQSFTHANETTTQLPMVPTDQS